MAITHKYTLICDDIRREDNGKLIILGLYMGTIALPQIPFVMPMLNFFLALESDRAGQWPMSFKLQHLESGRNLVERNASITISQPGSVVAPIKLGGVQFQAIGAYNFGVSIGEHREPLIVDFNVSLKLSQQMPQPGTSGLSLSNNYHLGDV